MNDDKYTITSGYLDVGNGHKIYYQQWGNQDATPTFFLHGGPGGGLKDGHKLNFDPAKHNLVFHDQRGSGLSTPFASLSNNTTPNLVEDIERLRKHLGLSGQKCNLYGGSWGSTLALAYAIAHADQVHKMLISGIYTGTKTETNYIQQGGLKTHFPDSWDYYISIVPEEQRHDTVKYYYEKMQDKDLKIADEHIRRWVANESAAMSIDPDVDGLLRDKNEIEDKQRSLALVEAHYFINNCFMTENYILENASKLKNIPIVMVQGRHDHVCPPETAWRLAKAIGPNCHLHITTGSHARESAFRDAIKAYTWSWL